LRDTASDGLLRVTLENHHLAGESTVLASTPVARCLEGAFQAPVSAGCPVLQLSR
jgi:hypothetical protein